VEIYNLLGEKIYTSNLTASITHMSIAEYPSGIYLYRVIAQTGHLISAGKLIVQK
jgi:hypothetical protein